MWTLLGKLFSGLGTMAGSALQRVLPDHNAQNAAQSRINEAEVPVPPFPLP